MRDRSEEDPLSTPGGPPPPSGRSPEPRGADDQSAFAAMLDEHEAHVFEYCRRLAGDESDAASATETAMIAAQSLLADPGRLRAWLFALARQELVTRYQPADQDQDDEIRDLVHLHGIRPEDLPAVLGVTAEQARVMLADAEAADAEIAGTEVAGTEVAEGAGADGAAEIAATVETSAPAAADGPAGIDGQAGTDELTPPMDRPGSTSWLTLPDWSGLPH